MKRRQPPSRVKLNPHAVWDLLNRRNMTQNELARLLDISSSYLAQFISGKRRPSAAFRKRMMDVLGVTRVRRPLHPGGGRCVTSGPPPPRPQTSHPGVALMPDDFPGRLEAVRDLLDLNWEEMAVALGVAPPPASALAYQGRQSQRRGDSVAGAAVHTVAGGVGGTSGRGRNRDLQTEKEEWQWKLQKGNGR